MPSTFPPYARSCRAHNRSEVTVTFDRDKAQRELKHRLFEAEYSRLTNGVSNMENEDSEAGEMNRNSHSNELPWEATET